MHKKDDLFHSSRQETVTLYNLLFFQGTAVVLAGLKAIFGVTR